MWNPDSGVAGIPGSFQIAAVTTASQETAERLKPEPESMNALAFQSVLTCPRCGFSKEETMPSDACLFYYECTNCGSLVRPKPGDCCVFCSFGSVKCPPVQMERFCCG